MASYLTPEQQKRVNEMAHMTQSEWESLCKKCGVCCLNKFGIEPDKESEETIVVTTKYCCENFDPSTRKCKIYQTRLNQTNCYKVDITLAINSKMLPASCGYVEYIYGPAKHPANVDFSEIRPATELDNNKTPEELANDIIYDSVLWNIRGR